MDSWIHLLTKKSQHTVFRVCLQIIDKAACLYFILLIFSLVIDISRYVHCRVWITSDVSILLTSLNVPHFRNSNAYNSVIYERKHKVGIHFLS